MIYQDSYIFILVSSVVLAIPVGIALRTLLVMKERVIVPILRMRTKAGVKQAITYKPSQYRPVGTAKPRCYIVVSPAKFTHGGSYDYGG